MFKEKKSVFVLPQPVLWIFPEPANILIFIFFLNIDTLILSANDNICSLWGNLKLLKVPDSERHNL